MRDTAISKQTAKIALVSSSTSPATLAKIAATYPELRAQVAAHPNVTPEILASFRRSFAQPMPHPQPMPYAQPAPRTGASPAPAPQRPPQARSTPSVARPAPPPTRAPQPARSQAPAVRPEPPSIQAVQAPARPDLGPWSPPDVAAPLSTWPWPSPAGTPARTMVPRPAAPTYPGSSTYAAGRVLFIIVVCLFVAIVFAIAMSAAGG